MTVDQRDYLNEPTNKSIISTESPFKFLPNYVQSGYPTILTEGQLFSSRNKIALVWVLSYTSKLDKLRSSDEH